MARPDAFPLLYRIGATLSFGTQIFAARAIFLERPKGMAHRVALYRCSLAEINNVYQVLAVESAPVIALSRAGASNCLTFQEMLRSISLWIARKIRFS